MNKRFLFQLGLLIIITSCTNEKDSISNIDQLINETLVRNQALVDVRIKENRKRYKRDLEQIEYLKEYHKNVKSFIERIDSIESEKLDSTVHQFIHDKFPWWDNQLINLNIPKETPRSLIKLQIANYEFGVLNDRFLDRIVKIDYVRPIIITDKDIYKTNEKVTGEILVTVGTYIGEMVNPDILLNETKIEIKDNKALFSLDPEKLESSNSKTRGLEVKVKIGDSTYIAKRTIIIEK